MTFACQVARLWCAKPCKLCLSEIDLDTIDTYSTLLLEFLRRGRRIRSHQRNTLWVQGLYWNYGVQPLWRVLRRFRRAETLSKDRRCRRGDVWRQKRNTLHWSLVSAQPSGTFVTNFWSFRRHFSLHFAADRRIWRVFSTCGSSLSTNEYVWSLYANVVCGKLCRRVSMIEANFQSFLRISLHFVAHSTWVSRAFSKYGSLFPSKEQWYYGYF